MANEGPLNTSVGGNDVSVGSKDWSNATNHFSSDNSYATVALDGINLISRYLISRDFGFSIPEGAGVTGFEW